jgi:hypothetical protein
MYSIRTSFPNNRNSLQERSPDSKRQMLMLCKQFDLNPSIPRFVHRAYLFVYSFVGFRLLRLSIRSSSSSSSLQEISHFYSSISDDNLPKTRLTYPSHRKGIDNGPSLRSRTQSTYSGMLHPSMLFLPAASISASSGKSSSSVPRGVWTPRSLQVVLGN